MTKPADRRLARQVAHAAGTFEHLLLGRSPASVSVVADGGRLVMNVHEPFSAVERRLAADEGGCRRVSEFHQYLFEHSLDALVNHVRRTTGVELRGAIMHVDTAAGCLLKTFTTCADVDLFLLGRGLPALGVPVNAHRHAIGINGSPAGGTGVARA